MEAVLAIDQGSSGTKVIVLGAGFEVLARTFRPVTTSCPREGWVEFSPDDVWSSVCESVETSVAALPRGTKIVAAGIANQRESAIAWERKTLTSVGPGISWQCRRGIEYCRSAAKIVGLDRFHRLTGLHLDTSVSAPKFAWLVENAGREVDVAVGTVESWLSSRFLGGGHRCEIGNASRTGLLDIETSSWSPELLGAFGVDEHRLGTLVQTVGDFGSCRGLAAIEDVPLTALCGDSHAALYTQYVHKPTAVKATYGTGSSILGVENKSLEVGSSEVRQVAAPDEYLARSIVWSFGRPTIGREGNVLSSGASLQWMARLLGARTVDELEMLAKGAKEDAVPIIVPALVGLGAPWHAPTALASVEGVSLRSGQAEFARAAFEAVAHLVADVADLLLPARSHRELFVDGGASRSEFLLQLQADLLGAVVVRAKEQERSALGAGYLAGLQVGMWSHTDLSSSGEQVRKFEPRMSAEEREERRTRWRAAVQRCLQRQEAC